MHKSNLRLKLRLLNEGIFISTFLINTYFLLMEHPKLNLQIHIFHQLDLVFLNQPNYHSMYKLLKLDLKMHNKFYQYVMLVCYIIKILFHIFSNFQRKLLFCEFLYQQCMLTMFLCLMQLLMQFLM